MTAAARRVDYSPEAVVRRLREMSEKTDLRTERRLECKVSYAPEAIAQRLKQQSMLRRACLAFGRLGSGHPRADDVSGTSTARRAS